VPIKEKKILQKLEVLMKSLYFISLCLAIIGSLNWGLVGLADYNLVSALFGEKTSLARLVYTLVGLSGVNLLFYTIVNNSSAKN
jgi:uncharacterized membrane protein YuzA (DUF378 family)